METLYPEAQRYSEKEKDTLAKALSRAAEDIWDCGDRAELQKLFQRVLRESPRRRTGPGAGLVGLAPAQGGAAAGALSGSGDPAPPAIRIQQAESWEPERLWWSCCREGEQAEVEQLVRRLNQRQIPIQEAEERFLRGRSAAGPLNRGGASVGGSSSLCAGCVTGTASSGRRWLPRCAAAAPRDFGSRGFHRRSPPDAGYFWWPPWCFPE